MRFSLFHFVKYTHMDQHNKPFMKYKLSAQNKPMREKRGNIANARVKDSTNCPCEMTNKEEGKIEENEPQATHYGVLAKSQCSKEII